jgi:hypothetical protein
MQFMKWWMVFRAAWLAAILFLSTACTHDGGVQASSPSFSGGDNLPFAQVSDKGGISPTASLSPASPAEVPIGTPITVRIESAVSSAGAQPGDSFQALLDVPVVIDGRTVIPSGSGVAGKVVAAKPASADNEFGFVRLTLISVSLGDKTTPVRTANIFVKAASPYPAPAPGSLQAAQPLATKDVEFPSERRLTFRLAQAFSMRR